MITLTREEAQQVLDALEWAERRYSFAELELFNKPIETLRAKLSEPEPEPVAWMYEFGTDNADAVNEIRWYKNVHLTKPTGMVRNVVPLYTTPPQREWQSLTDDDLRALHYELKVQCMGVTHPVGMYRVLEKALKEKNNG